MKWLRSTIASLLIAGATTVPFISRAQYEQPLPPLLGNAGKVLTVSGDELNIEWAVGGGGGGGSPAAPLYGVQYNNPLGTFDADGQFIRNPLTGEFAVESSFFTDPFATTGFYNSPALIGGTFKGSAMLYADPTAQKQSRVFVGDASAGIGLDNVVFINSVDDANNSTATIGVFAIGVNSATILNVSDGSNEAEILVEPVTGVSFSFQGGGAGLEYQFPQVDGNASDVLTTDGAGVLSWAPAAGSAPDAPDTSIQFNDGGVFGGEASFVFDKVLEMVTLTNTDFFEPTDGSIVIGADTGNHTMTGVENVLIGGETVSGFGGTGVSLTTGEENVFIGSGVGRLMQESARNVIIGNGAATSTGSSGLVSDNVVIGRGAGAFLGLTAKGTGNVLIGIGTGTQVNSNYAIGIGYQAMGSNTNDGTIALGFSALSSNTSGSNIGIGDSVGQGITTGTGNILIGSISGVALATNSSNNTFVGYQTGTNNEGNRNTFIGSISGTFPLGDDNVGLGYSTLNTSGAGSDQTIQQNTAIGTQSIPDPRTGADNNTALGYQSGFALTTGNSNTMLGHSAGNDLTEGIQNTFVGRNAGDGVITGSNNVFLGYGTTSSGSSVTGAIGIGISVDVNGSNTLEIGSPSSYIDRMYLGEGNVSSTPQTDFKIVSTAMQGGTGTGTSLYIQSGSSGGTNQDGADTVIVAGQATGNATSGDILFQTSDVGGSGSSIQTSTTKMRLAGNGFLGIGTSFTPTEKFSVSEGHWLSDQASTPTTDLTGTTLNDGGGSGATCSLTTGSTDTAGSITITAGNGTPGAGLACRVLFDTAYAAATMSVVMTPLSGASTDNGEFISTKNTDGFDIYFNTALGTSEVVGFDYQVIAY